MPYILIIETATKNCSVAVAKAGIVLICKEAAEENYTHAENLHLFIEQMFLELNISYKNLSAVAVSSGPGSYTGLRIGVSAAKGFCFSLQIPLLAINTLKALAIQAHIDDGMIIPMIDARRMEVFTAIFDANLNEISPTEAQIITADSFSQIDNDTKIYFVGDGAAKCKLLLIKDNFVFLDTIIYPSAKSLGKISYEQFKEKNFVDVAYFEPFYGKEFML